MMVNPPFRSTFDATGVDVKTTTEALIYSLVTCKHVSHQVLLTGRAHSHKHIVGALVGDVVYESLTLGVIAEIAVAMTDDIDAGKVGAQSYNGIGMNVGTTSDDVKRTIGGVTAYDV